MSAVLASDRRPSVPQALLQSMAHPKMGVLFCHAAGFCAEVWRPVLDELSALARQPRGAAELVTSAINLPGHGEAASEAPPLPLTPEPFCEAVLRAACGASGASNALGAGGGSGASLVGMGHSIGGTALVLAELARPGTLPP